MAGRETVHEVEARAAVAVDVPTERGDDLRAAVEEALEGIEWVRSAAVESVGDVESGDGRLRVHAEVDVTLHFDRRADADAASRSLADADPVAAVRHFERRAGPYEIEAW